jgi:hypothetical protein
MHFGRLRSTVACNHVESSDHCVDFMCNREDVDLWGPVRGLNDRLRSTAEAPHGNIVVELVDAHVLLAEGILQDIEHTDPGFTEAHPEVTDLGPEQDIQVTCFDHYGAQPREVGAMLLTGLRLRCHHRLLKAKVEGADYDLDLLRLRGAARGGVHIRRLRSAGGGRRSFLPTSEPILFVEPIELDAGVRLPVPGDAPLSIHCVGTKLRSVGLDVGFRICLEDRAFLNINGWMDESMTG